MYFKIIFNYMHTNFSFYKRIQETNKKWDFILGNGACVKGWSMHFYLFVYFDRCLALPIS